MATPWARFSLPGEQPAYARGDSAEFRRVLREIFGPLVQAVVEWPSGSHPWLMAEVPSQGSLSSFFRDLGARLHPTGVLWAVFPKKRFVRELAFPFAWTDVRRAGLAAGLVDNKVAAFSSRLTSIRFVVPLSRRGEPERRSARP